VSHGRSALRPSRWYNLACSYWPDKARDTRLDRSVAIKIIPPEVSADPGRRARFEREAKTIAAQSHTHICSLHDVGTTAA
jgi:serine/threonine protein kinase